MGDFRNGCHRMAPRGCRGYVRVRTHDTLLRSQLGYRAMSPRPWTPLRDHLAQLPRQSSPRRVPVIWSVLIVAALVWLATSTGCKPSPRPNPSCVRAKYVAACEQACTKLDGMVVVSPPLFSPGPYSAADCTCASSMKGSSAGWDDQRSFPIHGQDTVPGHEWNWHECRSKR